MAPCRAAAGVLKRRSCRHLCGDGDERRPRRDSLLEIGRARDRRLEAGGLGIGIALIGLARVLHGPEEGGGVTRTRSRRDRRSAVTSPSVGLALMVVAMFSAASNATDSGAFVRLCMADFLGVAADDGSGRARVQNFANWVLPPQAITLLSSPDHAGGAR
jgi:hypothetical protein